MPIVTFAEKDMEVNLMSDTVTRPTPAMLEAMMEAKVGDDVFGTDPTVNRLQAYAAHLFGKEAGLFCPSGTMTNQIALQLHTSSLSEVICEKTSHVYQYETGGFAHNARCSIQLLDGKFGKITAAQIEKAIRPRYDWLPVSSLVVLENTCNKGGGSYYRLEEIDPIREVCNRHALALHLDGARIFNALVETGENPAAWGAKFDTVSICLSKSLGAPVGSLLLGTREMIMQASRFRKVMGGGMRQSGYLAAAGLYALENNIDRLKEDHVAARRLGEAMGTRTFVKSVRPVMTNIVLCELDGMPAATLVEALKQKGILTVAMDHDLIRFVTHLDLTPAMIDRAVGVIKSL